MIKKFQSEIDVVTAARNRIKNIFRTAPKVYFAVSGGKDSLVLHDLLFKMCSTGQIDKSKLTVVFIDEEAIYPCCEELVKKMRLQWISVGVEFIWFCIECKHFNCFNMLTNDESFICWDRYKKDVWVRNMPPFAVTDHPLLNKRAETYQRFMEKFCKNGILLTGVRVSESVQRRNAIGNIKDASRASMLYPIYDWNDKDVWRYIRDNNLEFPMAYIYMYQCGFGKNKMRISQFFSIDTARSLVKMCEFYPNLFNKICAREPNAYLAMLYFDTEMFRKKKESNANENDANVDYKKKALDLVMNDDYFTTENQRIVQRRYKSYILRYSASLKRKDYKDLYVALVGGDPKLRTLRGIATVVATRKEQEIKK